MSNEFCEMVSDKVFCILGKETPYRMIRQSQAMKRPDSFRAVFNGKIRWFVPWSVDNLIRKNLESWPADDLALDVEDSAPSTDRFNSVE
jgi:hypothetical protein